MESASFFSLELRQTFFAQRDAQFAHAEFATIGTSISRIVHVYCPGHNELATREGLAVLSDVRPLGPQT
jgi:hypothetical protein